MIVDTSAVLAIVLKEPGWESLLQQAGEAPELLMSSGTLQEVLIVSQRKSILTEVEALLTVLDMDYVTVDEALARCGAELYESYRKGTAHPARLNNGDCFAAALATLRQLPLLYRGDDFRSAGF